MSEFELFRKTILDYYKKNKRSFPWRETTDPYKILVSEIMLQQTQTDRVVPKFNAFIAEFPDFQSLATAPLPSVLRLWSGLGYNRRALYLQRTAQVVSDNFNGVLPSDEKSLITLPGIGKYTAGAIMAFAFNARTVFIETNIRRVYIHFFFHDGDEIADTQLTPIIERTLPNENYREWYYALMDYGAYLAKTQINPNRRSKHYNKQSPFEGSHRQLRGKVLRLYLSNGEVDTTHTELAQYNTAYVHEVIEELRDEGLVD